MGQLELMPKAKGGGQFAYDIFRCVVHNRLSGRKAMAGWLHVTANLAWVDVA
jgi:hypothetical protein